ncbi:tRNA(Met)-cytidine N(4)-acetyltransferase [Paraglaciecola sp. T6c]|uniref:tRNA(Met) cytidine acetyltransferase TmcA n=1 Tax=Pseudoalteromonas atlantica (strain T6c / ATCC BAA-1087) TaxID=3042615 RepID=UPI00005C5B2E|nr:GNAT family N-acetyltransferase [Paraglaciecola sp. T6c]ABG39867.1 tRNA(Met)-cytidine N(4)-acetyltransferase [Paraglaciecola sp. T6c]
MDLHFKIEDWVKQRKSHVFHRQLVIVSGAKEWAEKQAENLLINVESLASKHLWVGDAPSTYQEVNSVDYRQHLGREYNTLIYNCYSGLSANALMAYSGTIKANGLMILICPELKSWSQYTDPLSKKRYSYGYAQYLEPSRFINRLISIIEKDQNTVVITPSSFRGHNAVIAPEHLNRQLDSATLEQDKVVSSIIKAASGHRNRPLVVTADRGRGKSSALGRAARALMLEQEKRILITAPIKHNVEQVFAFATAPERSTSNKNGSLEFVAPDALVSGCYHADLLFVDEAAAIPPPILKTLLDTYPRVVLSSTVHGYEGAGRGFELRFKPYLETAHKGWKSLTLSTPIRWYVNDCLEHFWFTVFIMQDSNSSSHAQPQSKVTGQNKIPENRETSPMRLNEFKCQEVSKKRLVDSPELLSKIFSLLISAHYQTSPDDLFRLLDAPEQRVYVCTLNEDVIGVALICLEGGSALADISQEIRLGHRRVNGHLVSQNLALHTADDKFVTYEQWRIVRIAVSQDYRRTSIASTLLKFVESSAIEHDIPLITSSFGATTNLLKFWGHSDYVPLKLGFKRDASSGEVSLIVGKSLSPTTSTLLNKLSLQFGEELIYHASRYHRSMDTSLLANLLTYCQPEESCTRTRYRVGQFIASSSPYMPFSQLLAKYVLNKLTKVNSANTLTKETEILVAALIQFKSTQDLVIEFNLNGKKELNTYIRNAIASI